MNELETEFGTAMLTAGNAWGELEWSSVVAGISIVISLAALVISWWRFNWEKGRDSETKRREIVHKFGVGLLRYEAACCNVLGMGVRGTTAEAFRKNVRTYGMELREDLAKAGENFTIAVFELDIEYGNQVPQEVVDELYSIYRLCNSIVLIELRLGEKFVPSMLVRGRGGDDVAEFRLTTKGELRGEYAVKDWLLAEELGYVLRRKTIEAFDYIKGELGLGEDFVLGGSENTAIEGRGSELGR